MYSGPFNHRGEPIAGNHRPTPRIAQMVANRLGIESQKQAFKVAPDLYQAPQAPSVDDAQASINNYRSNRDYNKFGPDADLEANYQTEKTGKFIGQVVNDARLGGDYRPDKPYGK